MNSLAIMAIMAITGEIHSKLSNEVIKAVVGL